MEKIWVFNYIFKKENNDIIVNEPDLDKTVIVKVVRRFESFTLDVNANRFD